MKEEYSEIISNHTQKTDTVRIAVAVTEDAEKLAELEKNTFSMPWSRDAFLESMQKDYAVFLKACLNEDIVGYIGVYKAWKKGVPWDRMLKAAARLFMRIRSSLPALGAVSAIRSKRL